MRPIRRVFVLLGVFFCAEMYSFEDPRIISVSTLSDSTRVLNKNVALTPSILHREFDALSDVYTSVYATSRFYSSLANKKQPTVEFDIWQKSEMRFQVYHEEELFFIDRWSFEFRKYIHGPKFAMVTLRISI